MRGQAISTALNTKNGPPDNADGNDTGGVAGTPVMAPERVANKELAIYALGSIGGGLGWTINMLTNPVFNMELHVSLVWLGIILAANRVLDAVTDLLIGYWSDRIVTPWGRRRPLVFVGSLLTGLLYGLMWMFPENMSEKFYLAWYGTVCVFFYIGTTLLGTGYWALGIELTSGYHERTRVSAWRAYASGIAGLMTPWFLWFIHNKSLFDSPIQGVRWLGGGVAAVIILSTLPVAILCKERYAALQAHQRKHISFTRAVTVMFQNKEFMRMTGVGLLMMGSLTLFEQFGLYVNFYYVFGGDKEKAAVLSGIGGNVGWLCGLLGIPLVQWLARRLGKHIAVRLALIWMILGCVMKWWCYTPEYPWLQLVIPFFYSIGIASFFTLTPSMTADIIDIDETMTGERREAMFSAVGNLINKIASAGAAALTGFVMGMTGFVVEKGGDQTAETFFNMRLMYSFVSGGVLVAALVLVWGYSLTEARMKEVQEGLRVQRERLEREDAAAAAGAERQDPAGRR